MRQKYEREIDEILRRYDDWPARRPRSARVPLPVYLVARLRTIRIRVSPTELFIAGLALALLGFLLRAVLPSLTGPLSLLSLLAFVAALVLSYRRGRSQRAPMWRGRVLYLDGPGWWDSLLRRWQRWRRR